MYQVNSSCTCDSSIVRSRRCQTVGTDVGKCTTANGDWWQRKNDGSAIIDNAAANWTCWCIWLLSKIYRHFSDRSWQNRSGECIRRDKYAQCHPMSTLRLPNTATRAWSERHRRAAKMWYGYVVIDVAFVTTVNVSAITILVFLFAISAYPLHLFNDCSLNKRLCE